MAFNRLVDRDIDADNPRTARRHLPAGLLSVSAVITFTIVMSLAFVVATAIFLPKQLPMILAVPVLLFLLGYSLAKRWTSLCHYWLSAALMLSPIAAWIAVRDEFALIPALLGGVIFFWVGGFDIIYACQDATFDRERNLNSIPARFGVRSALRIALLSHLITIAMLLLLWTATDLSNASLCALDNEDASPVQASVMLADGSASHLPVQPVQHIDDCFCCSHCIDVQAVILATVAMRVDLKRARLDLFAPHIFGSPLYHPPLA